ncbi:hypothetical protein RKD23_004883 [Streptomyces sp. SAI-170]|uniref:hypothetical protein n=1 Tax=Streptomyces sp. SAI-170 TaxID=3377729 RepID=UPI003C7C4AB7
MRSPFGPLLLRPHYSLVGASGARVPAYARTRGRAEEAFERGAAARRGGDQRAFRLVSSRDAAWAGALFAAVDAKQ